MVTAITGGGFGDEGKGKITDLMAAQADIVVRYQGGANAGHTIINDCGRFVLHLLPSGVFYPHTVNLIASGVAFDADVFLSELDMLQCRGVSVPKILVSSRAQLLLPIHKQQDRLEEQRLGAYRFGSTQAGIAPFYADKYAKKNIQISELYSSNLEEKVRRICEDKNTHFRAYYGVERALDIETLIAYLQNVKTQLIPYLCDGPHFLHDALRNGKKILLEGQLGALRDVDNGIYPYVTSSSPLAGFGSVGAGIPPYAIHRVVTVLKAYSTCVGEGPFVGELSGAEADDLRRRGGDCGEYGATTGRPRRMAWFDCVAARYGCMLQGATEVVLTVLDALGHMERIPVCVGYEIDGKVTNVFPLPHLLDRAKPVYQYLDGWKCDISRVTDYSDLPAAAKAYVSYIERGIGVPVTMVSNGPEREQILYRTMD